jgi:hypothetical protein
MPQSKPGPLDHLFKPEPEPIAEPDYETPAERDFAARFNKGLRATRGRTSTVSNPTPAAHKVVNDIIRQERSITSLNMTPGEVFTGYAPPEQQGQAPANTRGMPWPRRSEQEQARVDAALRKLWFTKQD